jgi:hypothetical protein
MFESCRAHPLDPPAQRQFLKSPRRRGKRGGPTIGTVHAHRFPAHRVNSLSRHTEPAIRSSSSARKVAALSPRLDSRRPVGLQRFGRRRRCQPGGRQATVTSPLAPDRRHFARRAEEASRGRIRLSRAWVPCNPALERRSPRLVQRRTREQGVRDLLWSPGRHAGCPSTALPDDERLRSGEQDSARAVPQTPNRPLWPLRVSLARVRLQRLGARLPMQLLDQGRPRQDIASGDGRQLREAVVHHLRSARSRHRVLL